MAGKSSRHGRLLGVARSPALNHIDPSQGHRMVNMIQEWLLGLNRNQKRILQILSDATLIMLSILVAFALRLDGIHFLERAGIWIELLEIWAVLIPISVLAFIKLGLYRAVVRYVSSRALYAVVIGVLVSVIVLIVMSWLAGVEMPRSVPVIYGLVAFILIGGLRFLMRGFFAARFQRRHNRVIIYGAGASGRQLQLALMSGAECLPVAFVDDNPVLHGHVISGCPVRSPHELPRLIDTYGAKTLLLAMPSLSRAGRSAVIRRLDGLPIPIQTIPGFADLVSGKTRISEIADVPVEDLLGRDPVPPRPDLMGHDLRGRVVMVTGAGGSIGSELCRQILEHGPTSLILFEVSEYNLYAVHQELQTHARRLDPPIEVVPVAGSVQNSGRVRHVLHKYGVQTIYHAAAYKHVPLVEHNPVEGIRNNVFGTKVLAEAAIDAGVSTFILISTDKAVRPTNVMGASKRMAELICQAMAARQSATRFSMVRFGNVLGSSGSVIPLFRRQIAAGGPITVTHPEITRYFMTIPEAAQLVIQAGAMARGGEVFILDMGEAVRIVDLAIRMAQLSGHHPVVIPPDDRINGYVPSSLGKDAHTGDIEIRFTGLRPGEKLYEELLIGNAAAPTEHPRIMTAVETFLAPDTLESLLERLMQHCLKYDVAAIQQLLIEARTGYIGDIRSSPQNLGLGSVVAITPESNRPRNAGISRRNRIASRSDSLLDEAMAEPG